MKKVLKGTLALVICLGAISAAAAGQSKTDRRTTVHARAGLRHKSSQVAMRDDSKKLNSDLSKLESQTSKTIRPSRQAPQAKAVVPSRSIARQDRHENPPMNFTNSSKKGYTSRGGGASNGRGAGAGTGPRLK